MAAPPDPTAAVVAFLRAHADVQGQLDDPTYVFGHELPRDDATRAAIVAGGTVLRHVIVRDVGIGESVGNRSRIQWSNPRMDVLCYGESPPRAKALDLACYGALKQMTSNVQGPCLLHDAQLVSGPIALREQELQWPFVFRSYIVAVAEVAVGV